MTIKEFCSSVRALFKFTDTDIPVNDRLIYNEGKSTAILLIKREANTRKLLNSPNIYTRIPCLSMIKVPLAECCDYTSDKQLSRSLNKIPKIVDAYNGLMIEYVSDIEKGKRFIQSTPQRYANMLSLGTTKRYFWVYNDYLYVSDSNIKSISLSAYFDQDPNYDNDGCDCNQDKIQTCKAAYDEEFKAPGYLIDNIKSMVYQKIQSVYQRSPEDRTSNQLDETSQ